MKRKISLLCLLAAGCAQTDLALDQSEQEVTYTPPPTSITPTATTSITWSTSTSSFPVTDWTSTQPVRWPSGASNTQILMRTGTVSPLGVVVNFYAFVVGDGSRLDRVYRVRTADFERFRAAIDTTLATQIVPGSDATYGINGGIYTGPKIGVGPAGEDPPSAIPGEYVTRILRTAASIEAATLQATDVTMVR